MAAPNLNRAVRWFEDRFDSVSEVNGYAPDCFEIVDGRLRLEGEPHVRDQVDPAIAWFTAACQLWELRGRPKSLRWRIRPRWEDGHVYSRLCL